MHTDIFAIYMFEDCLIMMIPYLIVVLFLVFVAENISEMKSQISR